jgi:proteasome lid subunit RPN8/RPN11
MMSNSESLVRLFPPSGSTPFRSRIPEELMRSWHPPFEDGVKPLVSVFLTSTAFVQLMEHCRIDLENEVGGGLVGSRHVDTRTEEQYVLIEGVIPARFTRQGTTFLTFTQDTLVAMNDELEECFPDRRLVGWYHTHPLMGVFLSHYDLWLHNHFFPEPWQVALVVEPHIAIGGFFVRQKEGDLDPKRYFGFHEILTEDGNSVVDWHNMLEESEIAAEEGDGDDE